MNLTQRLTTRWLDRAHVCAALGTPCFAVETPERQAENPSDVGIGGNQPTTRAGRRSLALRALSLLLLCALGLAIAIRGGAFDLGGVQALLASMSAEVETRTLIMLTLVYAVALALPFVPGVELGLLLMVAFGPRGVLLVYAASLLGLSLSYAAGRLLPVRLPPQPSQGIAAVAAPGQDAPNKLQSLVSSHSLTRCLPIHLMGWLTAHRYLALAIGLNLPGNMVFGGGGGIALLCGASSQYRYRRFLITVGIAVSPVPILMLLGFLGPDLHQAASYLVSETLECLNKAQ
jgi:hypothetical protein